MYFGDFGVMMIDCSNVAAVADNQINTFSSYLFVTKFTLHSFSSPFHIMVWTERVHLFSLVFLEHKPHVVKWGEFPE